MSKREERGREYCGASQRKMQRGGETKTQKEGLRGERRGKPTGKTTSNVGYRERTS